MATRLVVEEVAASQTAGLKWVSVEGGAGLGWLVAGRREIDVGCRMQ